MKKMKVDKLRTYEGNETEFKKYNEILKKQFDGIIFYYDNKIKKYFGNIYKNLYEGRGILYNESGDIIYDGFFKKGKYEGFGKLYTEKLLKYEGFFSNGIYEGKGNLYYNNKKIYEGYFHNGERNGFGIIYDNGIKSRIKYFKNDDELEYGILYDNNNNEIYSGESSNRPKNGKNIIIFNENRNKIYKGDFLNYSYNGVGILYYNDSNKIYFEGNFKKNNFVNGQLYDLEEKIIYQGDFIDNRPIKGNDIKLYDINKNLIYQGDFKDGKYHGFGKIFKRNILYYEGKFENDEIKGEGIKYYKNGNKHIEGYFEIKNLFKQFDVYNFGKNYAKGILYDYNGNYILETEFYDFIPEKGKNKILFISKGNLLFDDEIYNNKYNGYGKLYERNNLDYILKYEGNFLNGEINGKGIKFYKNGQKKFEGLFELNDKFNGIYFSPKGDIIYKGEIINDFFYDSEILEIYNNDGDLLYKGKIDNNDKKADNFQILKDVILCRDKILNNYYIDMKLNNTAGQISFISSIHSGRTAIIKRLIEKEFFSEYNNSTTPDLYKYKYIYNSVEYNLQIWNLSGEYYQYKIINKSYIKNNNITIYVVNLSDDGAFCEIYEEIITYIHENKEKNEKLIYLIIDKIDINKEKKSKLESARKLAKKLILDGLIYRYFELSAKTKEGFDEFENCLKFDLDLSLKLDPKNTIKTLEENEVK